MRTRLHIVGLLVTGTLLLGNFPSSAATPNVEIATHKKAQNDKLLYIGIASWYGARHQGREMANGERFDRNNLTAASWVFSLGTLIRVTNLENGESVLVTITDRGPNLRLHRILDLSEAAAERLDYVPQGVAAVICYRVASPAKAPAGLNSNQIATRSSKAPIKYQAKAMNLSE